MPEGYSLHSHWLAIEGKVPNIPENEGEDIDDVIYEKVPETEVELHHQLSLEQQKYYNCVLEALNTGNRLEEVLKSLVSDSSLTKLIPYISRSMFSMVLDSDDLVVLNRGVQILGALSMNKFLNLEPYLHQIMPALLSALMRGDLVEEGHWLFRKNTAEIVAKVCDHFSDYYEDLKSRVLKLYVKVLEDENKPPASHFSAIQGINSFGVLCIRNLMVPLLPMYLNNTLAKGFMSMEMDQWNMCKEALIVLDM